MKHFKRTVALILMICALSTAFTACADKKAPTTTVKESASDLPATTGASKKASEAVTDISEDVSEAVTDASKGVSKAVTDAGKDASKIVSDVKD